MGLLASQVTGNQQAAQVAPVRWSSARLIVEAMATFKQDLANIKAGVYKAPYDMSISHRQSNPFFVARKAAEFVREATGTLQRRAAQTPDDLWLDVPTQPQYYRKKTFHFQTDGWMSSRSAGVYETSTETLFLGRQDAMQRQTLVPLRAWMDENAGPEGRGASMLELACGTGRFGTFVRDNYPLADLTLLDASPFYLQAARDNMRYWESLRGSQRSLGRVSFVQGMAEQLTAVEDASMDVVYSVYMFHELPREVRKQVFEEVARVLKPGGVFVLTDSVQLGDRRPANEPDFYDEVIGNFGNFNEPYYRDYIRHDFGELGRAVGLTPEMKVQASSTKVLSFLKAPAPSG
ncbi:unnamed protein product [Pedinophyceae sp. YPF-701]|nr:unnamed protein product [Pedinophyceae sp. YPF-701]